MRERPPAAQIAAVRRNDEGKDLSEARSYEGALHDFWHGAGEIGVHIGWDSVVHQVLLLR